MGEDEGGESTEAGEEAITEMRDIMTGDLHHPADIMIGVSCEPQLGSIFKLF